MAAKRKALSSFLLLLLFFFLSPTHTQGTDLEHNSSSGSIGMIVGAIIAILVFFGIVFVVVYKCYYKNRHHPSSAPQNELEMTQNELEMTVSEPGNFSLDLIRYATQNFSENQILGKGGFGTVYRGLLQDGTQLAVKRMETNLMGRKGISDQFQAEIGVLTKVRHRHLVALLGFCDNGQEKLLVYEYMPQGTLADHLFENVTSPPLTWKQRVSIALDVARGVEYLHSLAQHSFIHRDLKPTNILLGNDMRAKVADFGLVKEAPDGNSIETRLAGTFGYLAPEYAATGKVTRKVDVYAYGVVLMQLITGRKASDNSLPEEIGHLVTWFRSVLINKESVRMAIDSTLDPDDEIGSICAVAELAGHCTARDPNQRPDMSHAVSILAPFVEQWKPSSHEEEEDAYDIEDEMSLSRVVKGWQLDEGTSSYHYTRTMGPDEAV